MLKTKFFALPRTLEFQLVTDESHSIGDTIFADPTSGVSCHFLVSSDGAVLQCVEDRYTAYHCGNLSINERSIGIELEGFADGNPRGNFAWQTPNQRRALTALVRWLCTTYSIPCDRAHVIGHNAVPSPGGISPAGVHLPPSTAWGGASGHHDPGAWFDWPALMEELGRPATYDVISILRDTVARTLPDASGPRVTVLRAGQRFVRYESANGFELVFISGLCQENEGAALGEYHGDAWISSGDAVEMAGAPVLEIVGGFPRSLEIVRGPPSAGKTTVVGTTFQHRRHAVTGATTVGPDGQTWHEIYVAPQDSIVTGWISAGPSGDQIHVRPSASTEPD